MNISSKVLAATEYCMISYFSVLFFFQVKPLYEHGDYEGAKQASQCAIGFSVASIFAGIITIIVIVVIRMVLVS